ncbi:hypothetical protein D3C84_785040 [compost metagenome]
MPSNALAPFKLVDLSRTALVVTEDLLGCVVDRQPAVFVTPARGKNILVFVLEQVER